MNTTQKDNSELHKNINKKVMAINIYTIEFNSSSK